jgi:hypothetical protein
MRERFRRLFYSSQTAARFAPAFVAGWCGFLLLILACSQAAASAISTDVTVSTDQNAASSTVSSPAFTTHSTGELLLAFISTDALSSPNTTVESVTGGGLTWVLVQRTNVQGGTAEIWRTFATATLQGAVATAKLSQSVVSSITVIGYTGVAQTGTYGSGAIGVVGSGHSPKGGPSATVVTTQPNSLVVGVGNDYDNAISRTPLAGQVIVHQDLSPTQDTYWVQRASSTTPVKGTTVTLGDSAPTSDQYNFSICEILPAIAQIGWSASSVSFSNVTDGTTESQSITLNSTGSSPLIISSASITGAGFSIVAASWPQTIQPDHSLTLQLDFAPKVTGSVTGELTLNINSTAGSSTEPLAGTGVASSDPQLTLSATSVAFGTVTEGTSATNSLKLTSTGTSPVTVTSDSLKGTGFSVANAGLPTILSPQQSLSLSVQFLPESVGAASGTLTVSSNSATRSTASVALTGTGGAASHSVDLTWNAPTSSPEPVVGYYIYRAIIGGTLALLNTAINVPTSYVDGNVSSGISYTYEIKSVASNGAESGPSNSITVTIPAN